MKISTKPTSLVLVGIFFICIFLGPTLAEPQQSGLEEFNKFKEHSFYSHHHEKSSDLGILNAGEETIFFPWYRQNKAVRPDLSFSMMSPKKEEILMDSSNSIANMRDLLAINSLKQRDLLYNDSQNGDPSYKGLVNFQDISASGKGNNNLNKGPARISADDFETSADEAASWDWQADAIGDLHHAGNYLNIDVHDISVSAINTVEGGSAVATSNIIIKPLQIIVCPSEVFEKLR